MNHCVPSNISSGLANLPLSHVYYKGVKTNKETVQILPTGEKLDGSAAYEMLLAYYTTLNLTADEVHDLGWKHVHILYQQVRKDHMIYDIIRYDIMIYDVTHPISYILSYSIQSYLITSRMFTFIILYFIYLCSDYHLDFRSRKEHDWS